MWSLRIYSGLWASFDASVDVRSRVVEPSQLSFG